MSSPMLDLLLGNLIKKQVIKIEKLVASDSSYEKEATNLDILYKCQDELEELKCKARVLNDILGQ